MSATYIWILLSRAISPTLLRVLTRGNNFETNSDLFSSSSGDHAKGKCDHAKGKCVSIGVYAKEKCEMSGGLPESAIIDFL